MSIAFETSHISMGSFPNMGNKIHVLLVEHENDDHDNIMNMLNYFSYQVTSAKLASTALSILSKEKVDFDIVMLNLNSPDSYGFELLQVAIQMNLLAILIMPNGDDDAPIMMRALEQGAFLCIKKPVTMQILGHLWQYLLKDKPSQSLQQNEQCTNNIIEHNSQPKEYGDQEDHVHVEDTMNNNINYDEEDHQLINKRVNLGGDNVVIKRKVWTEWTVELHDKFMDAARQLGEGKCYPKDILELMKEPGLTRMQVASHLQKCRNAKWLPPNERKKAKKAKAYKTAQRQNKAQRSKTMKFGSMPFGKVINTSDHLFHQSFQQDQFTINHEMGDQSSNTNVYNIISFAHDDHNNNGTMLNMGIVAQQTFGDQSVAPITNASSDNIIIDDDDFEVSLIVDSLMLQDPSEFQQELRMDCNGSWPSSIHQEEDYYNLQIPSMIQDALEPVNMNKGTEDGMWEQMIA